MINQPLVSIIVPIYNCEKVISRCIDSLVNQSYNNTEIILVNDGSKDKSADICNDYADKHKNVKYVYQENQGVSVARNTGLKLANGKYFIFCDADDYYALDAVENLVSAAEKSGADITIGGLKKFIGESTQVVCVDNFVVVQGTEAFGEHICELTENYLINSPFAKLYHINFIKKYSIYFNHDLRCGEDLEWNARVFAKAEKISGVSDIVYFYCVENQESLSQKVAWNYFDRINTSFNSLVSLYDDLGIYNRYEESWWTRQENNLFKGFLKINASNCNFTHNEKLKYIKNGLQSRCYALYKKRNKHYLSFVKRSVLLIKNERVMYVAIVLLGKIRK